ncbi:hypothetical protein [Rhodococcus sp. H29-C3]|uniref:hypothetical protein n=1 Tax=Rhodococcus sp. H29-C3 TaxID=3046307 RepID=UPI0024B9FCA5|nr:hypothetical protein [Rhodococcus sp. H29-C3]MDJ0363026.1 hypothetical protein [Rhodococcus sp. H29-C3]
MAPRDPAAGVDNDDRIGDWFTDTEVTESRPDGALSECPPERRLTVLTDEPQVETDSDDDDWFHGGQDSSAPHDGAESSDRHHTTGEYESFDARTAVLRDQRTYISPTPPAQSWWRRHRAAVAVTAALTVVIGGVAGAALVLTGVGSEPPSPAALPLDEIVTTPATPTSTTPAAAGAAAADVTWCAGQADGDPVTGDSDDPGAVAIWRFEKAFYFDRDGAAARAAGAPDAVMASAQRLQQGIDQLEPAIEFCVLADPVDAGIYNVTVLERGPGIDGRLSRQRITTTAAADGQTLIAAIVPR